MRESVTWLVVGGDGLIGRRLAIDAKRFVSSVVISSRRPHRHSGHVFADLATGDIQALTATVPDVAFLCAAMTNMQACQEKPELSYRVNVTETVHLAAQLVKQGAFVVFLSSNTVFNGYVERPNEDEPHSPVTEYGLQKSQAEQRLLTIPGANEHIAIVRLSKVMSPDAGIASEFLRRLRACESFPAFTDLSMAPISLSYAAIGLLQVASRKLPGLFHLSGAEELSYAEFAFRLAGHISAKADLVKAVSSRSALVNVIFSPKFPALGMKRTRKLLCIEPEPLSQVLENLVQNPG
jgi:dTDP-4-dehydrorhamnose reductase